MLLVLRHSFGVVSPDLETRVQVSLNPSSVSSMRFPSRCRHVFDATRLFLLDVIDLEEESTSQVLFIFHYRTIWILRRSINQLSIPLRTHVLVEEWEPADSRGIARKGDVRTNSTGRSTDPRCRTEIESAQRRKSGVP